MSWDQVYKINSDMTKPLNELISEKCGIKNVQRGTTTASDNVSIALSTINPLKTFVILQGSFSYSTAGNVMNPRVTHITSTSMILSPHMLGATAYPFSWQVIEFN